MSNKTTIVCIIIFVLALLVRLVYLYDSSANPTFDVPIVDSLAYDLMARSVAEGRGLTSQFFWQPFFYPFFLSVVYFFSSGSILCARIVQIVLGSFTCVLCCKLGQRIFDFRTGVLAGIITAFYAPLIFFEAELLAAGWAAFWSVAMILLFLKTSVNRKLWLCFVLGVCGALSIITRPSFVLFWVAGCIWLALVWIQKRLGVKKLLLRITIITAGFLTVAGPVAAVSYRVVQKISILPYSGGINFYIGNNPDYKQTVTSRPGVEWLEIANLPKNAGLKDRYEAQRFFYKKTFDYIVTQPISFLKGLGYKTAQFFSSREMPRNVDIYLFRKWVWLLWAGVWKAGGFGFPFGVLLPLAVVGAVYWRRSVPGPVWLFMIFYPLSLILVFVTSRYRMPVVPVMSVLAAAGCTAICRIFQQSRWAGLAVVAVFIFAVGWAGTAAGPFYEEQLDYEAEFYYELGGSLYEYGRIEEAIEAHSKAVELKSDYFKALHNLGSILTLQGRFEESIRYYRDALKVKDDETSTHNNLAVALQKQGELKEAVKHYERSLQLKSDQPKVLKVLAELYFLQGRTANAVDMWTQFLKFEPDTVEVINNLVWVKATYEDSHFYNPDEAVRLAMRACELTGYKQAVFMDTLAVAYAAAGDFAAAIRTAEEAAKLAAGDKELLGEIRSRIQLYKAGRCYREMGP